MTTNMDRLINFKTIIKRIAIGAFLGLAWGTSLRTWMALLVLKSGDSPHFTWEGTFGAILLPTALVGAVLGGATCVAESSGSKRWRWTIFLPLLLVLGPVIVSRDFIPNLVTTGLGGGAIWVALIGILGGYAFSGFGAQWTRWISGLLSLFFTLGAVYGIYYAAGPVDVYDASPVNVTPGINEAFGALLFVLLMTLLVAGVSTPFRYRTRQPIQS